VRLSQISDTEAAILRAIIAISLQAPLAAVKALARDLPRPLTDYTQALGQIREQEFGIPGRGRYRAPKLERRR
jgi:hypothetical protein